MDAVKTNAKKSRALKKYEAAPVAFATEPGDPSLGDPSLALFSPFGPLIAQAAMPQALVERMNRYADQVVGDGAGMEFLLPKEVVLDGGKQSLMCQTESLIRRYVALSDEPPAGDIKIDVFWIVSQRGGTPSPVHFHSCDISGVFYLKTPQLDREDEELQKTYISGRQAGYINFLIGGKHSASGPASGTSISSQAGSSTAPNPSAEQANDAPSLSTPMSQPLIDPRFRLAATAVIQGALYNRLQMLRNLAACSR